MKLTDKIENILATLLNSVTSISLDLEEEINELRSTVAKLENQISDLKADITDLWHRS